MDDTLQVRCCSLHRGILEVGLWIPLLSMDEQREVGRIAQEEDWRIVTDQVKIALLRIELDGEPCDNDQPYTP